MEKHSSPVLPENVPPSTALLCPQRGISVKSTCSTTRGWCGFSRKEKTWTKQAGRQRARSKTQKSQPLAASPFVLIAHPQLKYKQLEQRDWLSCPVQTLACDPRARRRQKRESSNRHIPCCTQQPVPQHMVSSGPLFSLCLQVPFGAVKTIQLASLVCSSYNTSCEQRPEL